MSRTSDIIETNTCQIRSISYELGRLASAFAETGNQSLAERLEHTSEMLHNSASEILETYRDQRMVQTNQDLTNSKRFIGSILTGLLEDKEPKDACIEAFPNHYDKDILEDHENRT